VLASCVFLSINHKLTRYIVTDRIEVPPADDSRRRLASVRRGMGIVSAGALAVLALAPAANAATVTPRTKDFGLVSLGSASAPQTFTLTTSRNTCPPDIHGTGCAGPSTQYVTDTGALGGPPGNTITSGAFTVSNSTCPYPTLASPAATGVVSSTAS